MRVRAAASLPREAEAQAEAGKAAAARAAATRGGAKAFIAQLREDLKAQPPRPPRRAAVDPPIGCAAFGESRNRVRGSTQACASPRRYGALGWGIG